MTCHASFEYAQAAIELGCVDYIVLPAKYEDILEHVKKTCGRIALKRQNLKYQEYGRKETMWKDAVWLGVPVSEIEKWNILFGDMTGRFAYYRCEEELPADVKLTLDISANSRYRLWINGKSVLSGPCKGDKLRHYYETVDVSGYLKEGKNVFAVQVLYCEEEAAVMQTDERAAIYGVLTPGGGHRLAVEGEAYDRYGIYAGTLTTGKAPWKVWLDGSFYLKSTEITQYLGAVCQEMDYEKIPSAWKEENFCADGWAEPAELEPAVISDMMKLVGLPKRFSLTQRPIPLLYEEDGSFQKEFSRAGQEICGLLNGKIVVKAGESREILVDAGAVTNGYLQFPFADGKGAKISITYFEKFRNPDREIPRDDYQNGEIIGLTDQLTLDGSYVCYEPFWYRTFRFIRIMVDAMEEDVTIYTPTFKKTGYPLEIGTKIDSSVSWVNKVWEMCVRTLKNCMMETYMDCPYYEQLQFSMDTRLQMLFNYTVSTDVRLARKALEDFHYSMLPEGLIQGKYPSAYTQVISTFSMHYIYMLKEFYWQTGDIKTVRKYFSDIDRILDYYDNKIGSMGLVEHLGYWEFIDWQKEWDATGGVPLAATTGPSTIINLMYAYALTCGAELNEAWGRIGIAEEYKIRSEAVKDKIRELCWDEDRNMYKEGPDTRQYTRHAQAWAVLNELQDKETGRKILINALEGEDVIPCSFSASYEWFRALEMVGMYEMTKNDMFRWKELLDMGCTTCPETPGISRSECHAWSALPMYEMVRIMAGISPKGPGWDYICIKPMVDYLPDLSGEVITPKGTVYFNYWKEEKCIYEVFLPDDINGVFMYPDGTSRKMHVGKNRLEW